MASSFKHSKVSAVPDGPDAAQVRPSDWNAEHTVRIEAPDVVVNPTGLANVLGAGDTSVRQALTDLDAAVYDHIDFKPTPAAANAVRRLMWDADAQTLKFGLSASVTLQIGQEHLVRGYNDTGAPIANGQVVYVSGAHSQYPKITLADNRTYNPSRVMGMATENIADKAYGYVTTDGLVHDVDTHLFVEGDMLWLGQTGGVVNVRPVAPLFSVGIGVCLYANPTGGTILVRVDMPKTLSFLSDVLITALADGHVPKWDAAATVWRNYQLLNRWEDVRIEPTARTTGANAPTFEQWFTNGAGSRGVYLYSFDKAITAQQKEIFFTLQLPHAWNGGAVHLHVHWIGDTNGAAATPQWGLEYTFKNLGAVFGNTAIILGTGNEQGDASIVALKHYVTELGILTPDATNNAISAVLIGRLFRNSGNVSDTYAGKCGLLYIDAHIVMDATGSVQEYVK
jgi:hypothetical protein